VGSRMSNTKQVRTFVFSFRQALQAISDLDLLGDEGTVGYWRARGKSQPCSYEWLPQSETNASHLYTRNRRLVRTTAPRPRLLRTHSSFHLMGWTARQAKTSCRPNISRWSWLLTFEERDYKLILQTRDLDAEKCVKNAPEV